MSDPWKNWPFQFAVDDYVPNEVLSVTRVHEGKWVIVTHSAVWVGLRNPNKAPELRMLYQL